MCHLSCVICHVSYVMCHMSCVMCHMSYVTCNMYLYILLLPKWLGQLAEGCYQRGLTVQFLYKLHINRVDNGNPGHNSRLAAVRRCETPPVAVICIKLFDDRQCCTYRSSSILNFQNRFSHILNISFLRGGENKRKIPVVS